MARVVPDAKDEVARTDFSGTIWFGATLIAASVTLAGLLSSGWRPADLGSAQPAWWLGSALAVIGILGLAYAGCPVEGTNIRIDDRIKTLTIRIGLVAFAVGAIVATVAVLVS